MIRETDPAADSEARQIEFRHLLRQGVEERQVAALGKKINSPIGGFVPRNVQERRTAQLHRAKDGVVAENLAFQIAANRPQTAAAILLPAYQRQISNLTLHFSVQLESFGKFVGMRDVAAQINK